MENKFGFDCSGLKAYSGHFIELEKLKKSASGGGATAISEAMIKAGGVVFGVIYNNDFNGCEYFCAEKIEDLQKLKGSKYIETTKQICCDGVYKSVYEVVATKLQEGKKVLFVGLECVIAALYKHIEIHGIGMDNLYTVSLICHGTTFPKVLEDYIATIEKKYSSKVKSFTVRHKKSGVRPIYIRAEFENGKLLEIPFYETDYGYAFGAYTPSRCYSCSFRGENHMADVTVGDCWGLPQGTDGYNKYGVSVFITKTQKGEQLIAMIDQSEFRIDERDIESGLKYSPVYYKMRKKPKDWEVFKNNLEKRGLHYAVMKSKGTVNYMLKSSGAALKLKALLKKW